MFGAGTMGPGLALVFALGGHEVSLYSRKAETLERAMMTAPGTAWPRWSTTATITLATADRALALIHPTQSVEEAGREADFVMETIAENKDAKTLSTRTWTRICPERTVFASNTSSLNIFELDAREAAVATRWSPTSSPRPTSSRWPRSSPVPRPPRRRSRSPSRSSRPCGKTPVVMKRFGPGFIVNRIQRAIGETCMDMVQEGLVEPEEIDQAIKATLGIRLPIVGVMQTFDFQGLDMLLAYQKNVGKVYSFVEERVERGALGAKTSKGIYDYQGRSEAEILKKRDELYLKMIDYLTEIGAFEPV